jgi:hypothetical protein
MLLNAFHGIQYEHHATADLHLGTFYISTFNNINMMTMLTCEVGATLVLFNVNPGVTDIC